MADAYARTAGRPAVLTVHQGCGLTNAMTGIAEAAKSRTPLLVLAADTGAAAVRSNFRIDQDALVTAVGAVAERVHTAASAAADVVRAYRTAVEQRRTVVLNLPLDVQAAPAPDGPLPAVPALAPVRPAAGAVAELAALIAAAERPVFVAGRGARSAPGASCGRSPRRPGRCSRRRRSPTGCSRGDPWSLGISGGFASPLAAELIRDADLVVGWGCALNMWTTRHGTLIGPAAPRGAGRPRRRRDRRAPARRPRRASATSRATADGRARRGSAPRHRLPDRRRPGGDRAAGALARRAVRRPRPAPGGIDPRTLSIALDDAAARRADRRGRLRQLHGLPERVPRGARRGRLLLHPGVPVDRARAGHRDRRGAGPAGPAAGRRARRRRRADGGAPSWRRWCGSGCRWSSWSTTTRLRRRGAPLPRRATTGHGHASPDRPRRDRPRLRVRGGDGAQRRRT